MQLASYSAASSAHYTPHLDRAEHEAHNKREIVAHPHCPKPWPAFADSLASSSLL